MELISHLIQQVFLVLSHPIELQQFKRFFEKGVLSEIKDRTVNDSFFLFME